MFDRLTLVFLQLDGPSFLHGFFRCFSSASVPSGFWSNRLSNTHDPTPQSLPSRFASETHGCPPSEEPTSQWYQNRPGLVLFPFVRTCPWLPCSSSAVCCVPLRTAVRCAACSRPRCSRHALGRTTSPTSMASPWGSGALERTLWFAHPSTATTASPRRPNTPRGGVPGRPLGFGFRSERIASGTWRRIRFEAKSCLGCDSLWLESTGSCIGPKFISYMTSAG